MKAQGVGLSIVLLVVLGGCDGHIASGEPVAPDQPGPDEPVVRTDPGPAAFDVNREAVRLLPFDVRLQRVADAVGVSTDDALLSELRANRLELGDHDYGAGIPPDLAWTGRRMAQWARALRPVCESETFRSRYPDLRESLESFTLAAYGRRATPEDLEAYDAALEGSEGLDDVSVQRTMCIAMLSSTDLVAR